MLRALSKSGSPPTEKGSRPEKIIFLQMSNTTSPPAQPEDYLIAFMEGKTLKNWEE
jgi:hypothetical protein